MSVERSSSSGYALRAASVRARKLQSGKKREIRQLTGIRIVAALWVVFHHYQPQIFSLMPEIRLLEGITSVGYLAVDLFFVLSGFILCYQYLERFRAKESRDYLGFLWKRLARIYPAHLAVLLGLGALVTISKFTALKINDPENYDTTGFLLDLSLVRSWIGDSQGWNIPAWSLSAEWLAYVLFPLFAAVAIWLSKRKIHSAAVSLGILVVAEGLATLIYPSSYMPMPSVRIVLAFGAGCVVYLISQRTVASRRNGWIGAAALIALMTMTALIPVGGLRASLALTLASATVYFLATGTGVVVDALGSRWMERGGLMSFSLYLIHVPMLMLLVRLLPTWQYEQRDMMIRAMVVAAYILSSIAGGALLYRLVEAPGHAVMMYQFNGRRRRGRSIPKGRRAAETK